MSRVRRALTAAAAAGKGPRLVVDAPWSAFHIPYLLALFPDARFLWVYRDPIEEAGSIARASLNGDWHGEARWEELTALAQRVGLDRRVLASAAQDPFNQGLVQ